MKRNATSPRDPFTKILVVDDREENRTLLRYLFGPPEFNVLEAVDGLEALELIEREMPDCVLLDLDMPRLTGFEVLERVDANSRLRDIPIIVVTASDESPESMERALRAGAIDYITKPISLLHVRARVRGAVERRRLLRDIDRMPALAPGSVPGLRTHLDEIATYADLLQQRDDAPEDVRRTYVSRIHQACRQVIARASDFIHATPPVAEVPRPAPARPEPVSEFTRLFPTEATPSAAPAMFDVTRGGFDMTRGGFDRGRAADPSGRLDQVLRNVLSNALAFRATGGRV